MGTASNIKDKKTRKKVCKALSKLEYAIGELDEMPRGFFAFANDKDVWILEPDTNNIHDIYHCGKRFLTEYIEECDDPVTTIELSLKECVFYKVYGSYKEQIYKITSGIPSAHNQGGQSQGRFRRKRAEAIKHYLRRVKLKSEEIWPGTESRVLGGSILVKRYLNQ